MSSLRCPVCKADNSQPPTCRRCKADLSLLFALEESRAALLNEARQFADTARWRDFLAAVENAQALRNGDDTRRLRAVGLLLVGDKAAALRQAMLAREKCA